MYKKIKHLGRLTLFILLLELHKKVGHCGCSRLPLQLDRDETNQQSMGRREIVREEITKDDEEEVAQWLKINFWNIENC